MKRIIALTVALLMIISVMCACDSTNATRSDNKEKILVYTSFYTMYDFTLKIAGDKAVIKNMVPAGSEPHNWEPTPKDIAGLYSSDLFIYSGYGMESWVPKVLESIKKSELIAIEASKSIDAEKILRSEHDHSHNDKQADEYDNSHEHNHTEKLNHDHTTTEDQNSTVDCDRINELNKTGDHDQTYENDKDNAQDPNQIIDHDHSQEHAYEDETHSSDTDGFDPHVWLNPLNAKKQMEAIKNGLVQVDPSNSKFYQDNFDYYAKKFDDLDKAYKDAAKEFTRKEIVVSHEAFGYLCNAYGLTQVAIEGISSESEPTPAKMAQIIKYVQENDVKVIFFEELASPKVAEAIARNTGAKTDLLNPLEGLSEENLKAGKDYFSVMEENLEALKRALVE
jgi:zinc transport system substrate-binding protein